MEEIHHLTSHYSPLCRGVALPASDHSARPKILVADDNQLTLELIADTLEPQGYDVRYVKTGKRCLEEARIGNPDLILLDLRLPGDDGETIAKSLRSDPRTSRIPIVAVTAYSIHEGLEGGALGLFDGYLPKPFSLGDLLQTIRSFLKPHSP